jgi:threonine synthase
VTRLAAEGRIGAGELVVCVLTGSGLKDPATAERNVGAIITADATVAGVVKALDW